MDKALQKTLLAMKKQDERARVHQANQSEQDHQQQIRQTQNKNAERLNKILDVYGWPSVALVGEEGAYAAWLVAQNAIDTPVLQRRFLASISGAGARGEVPQRQVAFLLDLVRFNQQQPQLYGTALDWNEHGTLAAELENPEQVDEYRQLAGFDSTYQQSIEYQLATIKADGGKPPANYQAYKQQQLAWAKRVGWLNNAA